MKKYGKNILNILIPIAVILLVCFAGPKVVQFFMPFIIGLIISMIANPLVRFLEKRLNIIPKHGTFIIIILVLGIVFLGGYWVVARAFAEFFRFLSDAPAMLESLQSDLVNIGDKFANVIQKLPEGIQQVPMQILESLSGSLGSFVKDIIANPTVALAGNIAKNIPNLLVTLVIIIMSAYSFTAHRNELLVFWKKLLPDRWVRYGQLLKKNFLSLIAGYFMAQLKIMAVIFAILLVGFLLLQIGYSVILAILIALLDFLPVFGTGTVLIPWALVKLLTGEYTMALWLLAIYAITQAVRQLIQPKIVGDSMGISPMMSLVFLYLGFRLYGIGGMILAVPVGVVVIELYKVGVFDSLLENIKVLIEAVNQYRQIDKVRSRNDQRAARMEEANAAEKKH